MSWAGLAAALTALALAMAAAPPPPRTAPPGVEILEDGSIVHRPSGMRLPREIRGPQYTHRAMVSLVDGTQVRVIYGAVSLTIGPVQPEADAIAAPSGTVHDSDPPALPALLFWGESAGPVTYSFLSAGTVPPQDWLSFVVVTQDWQIELSALYPSDARDTVIRTAEAVWATLASANDVVRK